MSNHNSLLLCTEHKQLEKKNGFTFETSWINHPDFVPKINGIWEKLVSGKSVVDVWVIELKRVKKFLKGWGINLKGQTKRYKRVLQEELLVSEQKKESLSLLKKSARQEDLHPVRIAEIVVGGGTLLA